MGDVILEDLFLRPAQRGTNGRDLRYDVDAVTVLLDHTREAAHLALDAAEPFLDRRLDVSRARDLQREQGGSAKQDCGIDECHRKGREIAMMELKRCNFPAWLIARLRIV